MILVTEQVFISGCPSLHQPYESPFTTRRDTVLISNLQPQGKYSIQGSIMTMTTRLEARMQRPLMAKAPFISKEKSRNSPDNKNNHSKKQKHNHILQSSTKSLLIKKEKYHMKPVDPFSMKVLNT